MDLMLIEQMFGIMDNMGESKNTEKSANQAGNDPSKQIITEKLKN